MTSQMTRTTSRSLSIAAIAFAHALCTVGAANAQPVFEVVHTFAGGTDGNEPGAGALIQLADGTFRGTTFRGGSIVDRGTVFGMTTDGAVSVLHSFLGFSDGAYPNANVVQASDGDFYGTTYQGGLSGGVQGSGTVFRMAPDGTVTILHVFTGGGDGAGPRAGLIEGTDGNLYGETELGGVYNDGTIFMVTLDGTTTVVHSFHEFDDGLSPVGGLTQGSDGNLYGTTVYGGAFDVGTAFQMTLDGTFTVLHSFTAIDGARPSSGVIEASDGNFYGTTQLGGDSNNGAIFQMTPDGTVATLYSFGGGSDGAVPPAGLIQAADGSFYGITDRGGPFNSGTVFQMTPDGAVSVNYAFTGGADGWNPEAPLVQAADGNLYGTTDRGGSGFGVVFRLRLP